MDLESHRSESDRYHNSLEQLVGIFYKVVLFPELSITL